MQYAAVKAALFTPAPPGTPHPAFTAARSPLRRLRDAFEPIAMHQVWAESAHRAVAAAGPSAAALDFFTVYAWGRAAVLGDVVADVAAAAFAVFEPDRVAAAVAAGAAAVPRSPMLAALDTATIAGLRSVLGTEADGAELAAVADRLATAVQAADGTGRPLFCGVRALGFPDDPVGRLWRSCHALREHRGDSHTAAFVAAGLDPVRMNILTELWIGYPLGGYSASRRWPAETTAAALEQLRADGLLDGDTLTASGRALRDGIEAATDRAQRSVADALGEHLDAVVPALERWSDRCVAAGWFPPDFRKRYAG